MSEFRDKIFEHKQLDYKCVEEGCQSLFLAEATADRDRLQRELEEARAEVNKAATLEMCLRVDLQTVTERADKNWRLAEALRERADRAEEYVVSEQRKYILLAKMYAGLEAQIATLTQERDEGRSVIGRLVNEVDVFLDVANWSHRARKNMKSLLDALDDARAVLLPADPKKEDHK